MTGETKFNFDRIPVETVRKIALDFPAQSAPAIREPGHLTEISNTGSDWKELAMQVQQERDPKRMLHLVDQLIQTLDRNRSDSSQVASAAEKPTNCAKS
jgi:hypothetical protein